MTLPELCLNRDWQQATDRAISHPEEAVMKEGSSSPLAIACRLGAPASCIRVILDAAPEQVRQVLPSRGTPLHEAVLCDKIGSDVVKLLLEADGRLEGESVCMLQDVDGRTPLHLLIRQRFQTHLMRGDDDNRSFEMLQIMVESCPEAVSIPDRGEYEEPPLVKALKASLYAGGVEEADGTLFQRVERRIHRMVGCMLEHYPQAASQILTGARGHYTALHSAVFHGRCSDTIHLLLQAEQQGCATSRAALLANTQGELPLHFCAMRGEPPRSVALLANAAPMAVLTRDVSGLTPFHWLWIRFVSTLLALDNDRGETTVEARRVMATPGNRYQDLVSIERGDFYADLDLIRRVDPPVDFLRMRHIPSELLGDGSEAQWANRSIEVLANIRQRYFSHSNEPRIVWTRREAVTSLFWSKVVSLLRAADSTMNASSQFHLVRAALACPSCPPPVAQMVCALFPEELSVRDPSTGRLPLHYAACRTWHSWDWPRSDAQGRPTRTSEPAAKLLCGESIAVLMDAIEVSSPRAARITDRQGRLVLHLAIDSFVRACSNSGQSYMVDAHKVPVTLMLEVLQRLVEIYPESLERRDGKTKLYPFLQATAAATEYRSPSSPNGFSVPFPDEMPLSMTYSLLRENPSLVATKLQLHTFR